MKKFIGFLALLVLCISFSAMGLDPPRDHTPPGYEIAISDAEEITTIAAVFVFEDVTAVADEGPWQPPGVLYEFGITTETLYPYTLTGELQQNSTIILYVKDRLSDLQTNNPDNRYRKTKFLMSYESLVGNYNLFRCDRARYV